MTKPQRIHLMAELWPNACQVQGWREDDRDLRLHVCSIALSFDVKSIQEFHSAQASDPWPFDTYLKSTNEIDEEKGFTRVKGLLLMLADRIDGAMEAGRSEPNKARQKRFVVGNLVKCIALYHPDAQAYVAEIIRGKFKHGSRAMPLAVDDLSTDPITLRDGRKIPSQLDQLLMTLTSRLHNKRTGFRAKAGDSVHDMNLKAGLKCSCEHCVNRLVLAVAEDPNWSVR